MAANSNSNYLISVPKLKGRENYSEWCFAVENFLVLEGMLNCIKQEPDQPAIGAAEDAKTKAKIILTIDPSIYVHIKDVKTTKMLWDKLKALFDDSGFSRRISLLRNLISIRLDNCVSMTSYVTQIVEAGQKLAGTGFNLSDEWIGSIMLAGLNEKYSPMIMAIEHSGMAITTDAIKSKLIDMEPETSYIDSALVSSHRYQHKKNEKSMARNNNHGAQTSSSFVKTIKCYNCKQTGHYRNQCRNTEKPVMNMKNNERKQTNAFSAVFFSGNFNKSDWYVDSGASRHLTTNEHWVIDASYSECTKEIIVANQTKVPVLCSGNVKIMTSTENCQFEVMVEDVLCVPSLTTNLLSVSQLIRNGNKVVFTNHGCEIYNKQNTLVATASLLHGVYKLNMSTYLTAAVVESMETWHRRLGHINSSYMNKMQDAVEGVILNKRANISKINCVVCCEGKQNRFPFPHEGNRCTELLKIVHTDICGPMENVSLGGSRYFLLFIDDHSRMTYVYFLKNKNEALKYFKEYKLKVENLLNKKIKILRSDNGGEFCNNDFENYLKKMGITHQKTNPYTPEQNGVSERMNRSIIEKARCLLFEANLEKRFWAEAVNTAVYLQNRIVKAGLNDRTPYELWMNTKPNLSHLRVFGSTVMLHVPKEKRHKWDKKSEKCILVGYPDDIKGYRVYNPRTQVITTSRDVVIFENSLHQENVIDIEEKEYIETEENPICQDSVGDNDSSTSIQDTDPNDKTYVPSEDSITSAENFDNEISTRTLRPREKKKIERYGFSNFCTENRLNVNELTLEDALRGPEREHWEQAVKEELQSFEENNAWELVDTPSGGTLVKCKWVLKKKTDDKNKVTYRARLVAKGCTQKYKVDYEETFSPVVSRGVGVGAAPSGYPGRGLYLELGGGGERDLSPPSDNVMFDNQCYATTPSSSNGNSDQEPCQRRDSRQHHHAKPCLSRQASQSSATPAPGSPTSRLLLEYEMHLRNTLAKGMDAESYSLHTFEALLSQSMEDLEYNDNMPQSNQRSPYPPRRRPTQESILHYLRNLTEAAIRARGPASQCSGAGGSRSSTLPLPHRLGVERQHSARSDKDGYYSDRNELMRERERERERERGYLSDHNSRDRVRDRDQGYLSDHQSSFVSASRCASCIGESARAAWYRHSDGWRGAPPPGPRRSPWDSLPSLRHEGSLNDSGYRSNRADSFEQRGVFDRQDSVRSEYTSDRESTRYGIVQQASIDSTDSRICYLTSSEISDDDRMSLTTAVSDEEEPGESAMNSPYKGKQTGAAAASFNCTGAVRKAGFLSVKKWLLRKKHQIELARKRGWKGYWVCLKGTTLLFYPCDSREGRSVEAAPKHLIIVDGAIMQPIPEHPKRDYIFCLSTAFGDAYLFQAPCQVELENWVNSIHSACAAAFARHRGKTGTLHLLQEEIYRLEKAIESDHKLKHMADLQQSVVSDPETRAQLAVQMLQWEENLERLHCEQFRLRCYMASLQSGELPNPKSLLTHVSRGTKSTLNKLGVFTVSSFHAFICARSPSLLNNLLAGRGATKRRAPNLSRSNSGSSRRSMQMSRDEGEAAVRVSLPEGTTATVGVREGMSVEEFLAAACARRSLNPLEHFVRVKKRRDMEDHNYFVPHRSDLIETYLHTHEVVEVCAKILYQVELQRTTLEQMWGFSVEAELIENAERQDELCCYVSRVEDKSVAMQNGIIKGDEIMVINGAIVSDLDMMYLESVLQEELSLVMMMRSSRTEPPELAGVMRAATDDIIDSLVCPPPPSDPPVISDDMISGLIVPAPAWSKELYSPDTDAHGGDNVNTGPPKVSSRTNSFEIENLLKSAEQVTGWCRSPAETRRGSPTGSVASAAAGTPSRHLSDADKLRKVLMELVDTERAYVKHLNNLLENYLEPLKKETFLSNAEINALFGNIQEIVTFQRQFLQNLEEALEAEPNFHHFEFSNQFKNALFAVGNAFLYYVNHFKLYSSFCASHSKAQKVLHPNEGNQALQEFLAARNPKQQHSSTLESYLIKPIQRILKYPLLLQQLRNLTDANSEEHLHLVEALKGMEKVAEHINEMQRIHEEYGAIFDHLFRQHQKSCKQPIDLSPGDLLYYGGVEWLNISDFLGKIKKGLELHAMCFVFKSAVVFLCKERLRQKKKLMGVSSKNNSNEVEIIRYQVLIPVTEVQVRASSAKDMDSHFLWELIHLRSQLQRRSEKVYVLSNSTADFRNAFLKTIRQIIRESVRNMSLPSARPAPAPPRAPHTLDRDRPKHQVQVMQGSQTLGKTKKPKTTGQRLSAGNIEVGDLSRENSQDADEPPQEATSEESAFRHRSKTLGDTVEGSSVKRAPPPPPPADVDKSDPGSKSEGEDDQPQPPPKRGLGRTPNHLTLSTTSTLSAGSTGSQARLIQSSHQPAQYQPTMVKELGSPVWKPRDMLSEAGEGGGAAGAPPAHPAPAAPTTLPRSQRPAPRAHHLSASRKSLAPDHRH